MHRVKQKKELRNFTEQDTLVFVESQRKLYRNFQGEWIEKAAYSVHDISQILQESEEQIRMTIRGLNMRPKQMQTGVTYGQLGVIAKALRIRKQNKTKSYENIRKELNV